MDDAAAEVQKARVNKYLEKWRPAGFGWWRVDLEWDRGSHDDCDTQRRLASCKINWEYRAATISFVLPALVSLNEEELEETVVHELAHLLIASIQDYSDSNTRQLTEYAVTCVTRALLWTNQHVPTSSNTFPPPPPPV